MKKIVYLSLFVMLGCGLPYANKTKLSESELDWFPYEVGNTVLFTCGASIDTMIITETNINNPRNTFIFDTEGIDWIEGNHEYKGNASCKYKLFHNGTCYEGILFVLTKECANTPAYISISFAGNYSKAISTDSTFTYTSDKLKCISFDTSELHRGTHQKVLDIRKIIWSKDYGLLEYFTNSDSIFTYDKSI